MKVIGFIVIGLLTVATLLCLLGAQGGDNVDARATAGLLYIPAIIFGVIDASVIFAMWAWWH